MSLMTSSYIIKLRSFTKKIGFNKFIGMFSLSKRYERNFWDEFNRHICKDDIVWDVGANVGVYTKIFLGCCISSNRID
jgi:hypothetical protein